MPAEAPAQVAILLSTWNGAAYLPAQLASFCAQKGVNWRLYWRDDGSDDASCAIMHAFAAGDGAGRVVDCNDQRGRVGIAASFMSLLRQAPSDCLIAFADQDDVWLPEKLERGARALASRAAGRPALYCARQFLVDGQLNLIRPSRRLAEPPGFPQSLTQNIATGCTVMLNPEAKALLAGSVEPPDTQHDWWAYLVVSAKGGLVLVDEQCTVQYRQHGSNAVGVPLSSRRRVVAALRRGPRVFMHMFRQHSRALLAQPQLLSAEAEASLHDIDTALSGGLLRRLAALPQLRLRRQDFGETQLFRLWFLLG